MKPNAFKYSVLTVGITAAMGIAGTASADTVTYNQEDAFEVKNVATATYNVAGDVNNPQTAESNEVTINVTETGAFSLVATLTDGNQNADDNADIDIEAPLSATVDFTHTLKNEGNVTDTYTIDLVNQANDNFDYDLDDTVITYQKIGADGDPVGGVVTINRGDSIELAPGESADITITAISDDNRVIDSNGILTVTATSQYLTGKGEPATATNIDNAITTAPIYAITKSANSNLNNNIIDLNNDNAYVDYTITVENEGTADGTDITITDALPNGLVAIQTGEPNYRAPTTSGAGNTTAPVISSDGRTITASGVNVAQGQTVTITFRAKKSDGATDASDFTNYAVVTDDLDGDNIPDITDSTDDNVDNTFEDPNDPNNRGEDNNDDATVTPSNQTRDLNITDAPDKEVPLQSTGNGYTYTISNDGTDVTEADAPDEVLFTVEVTDSDDPRNAIDITTVFVDTNGNGILDNGETVLTPNGNGEYDLNDADTDGLAPGESVNIGVLVDTNGSGSNNGQDSDIGKNETITITVLPQGEVEGTPAPTDDISQSSKTTMQGIDLFKFQAAAACGTDPQSISNWTTANVVATADQCAFYRLEATNTFTNTEVNTVTLSDVLASTLTYAGDYVSDTSNNSAPATADISGQNVGGTFATLTGQEVGNIYFSATISQTGTNPAP
ncbi:MULTISPECIES: hypothetical protein [unclassified Psychrobacter]|uniref:hypothetical protein n=1 Tax=unclassified Psychrobacter TaxID=196806 RepID=UPI003FD3B250